MRAWGSGEPHPASEPWLSLSQGSAFGTAAARMVPLLCHSPARRRMEICPFVLQGAGIIAQGSLVSVCFGSGDACGFVALILGLAFKSGELAPPCNGRFWFSPFRATCKATFARGSVHWAGMHT